MSDRAARAMLDVWDAGVLVRQSGYEATLAEVVAVAALFGAEAFEADWGGGYPDGSYSLTVQLPSGSRWKSTGYHHMVLYSFSAKAPGCRAVMVLRMENGVERCTCRHCLT